MIDNRSLALMTGADILIPECNLIMHQPSLYEISQMGEKNFFAGAQLISIDKSIFINTLKENVPQELVESLTQSNNFDLMLQTINNDVEKKELIKTLLIVLFPQYNIIITPRSISFAKEGNSYTIDKDNFIHLQQAISDALCLTNVDQQTFNPGNKKAEEITQKLLRARQRVAAQKNGNEGQGSSLAQYISVITIGIPSMNLSNALQLTLFQMYDLIQRLNLYINWDIDLRTRLAGGKPDKSPDNWMKKLY